MVLKNISEIYLGSTPVTKIYLGGVEVYSVGATISDIIYTLDSVGTDAATGLRIVENTGSTGSADNTVAKASNSIFLNGIDQSVKYPLIHDLGLDDKKLADSVDIGWTDNLDHSYTGATVTGNITGITTLVSGTVKVSITISGWVEGDVNGYGADGTYTFEESLVASLNLVGTGFTGVVVVNSIEEITIPTNSYLTYFDYDLKEFVTKGFDTAIGDNIGSDAFFDGDLTNYTSNNAAITITQSGSGTGLIDCTEGWRYIQEEKSPDNDYERQTDNTRWLYELEVKALSDKFNFGSGSQSISISTSGTISFVYLYYTGRTTGVRISAVANIFTAEVDNLRIIRLLDISTTFNLDRSHQNVFTHTAPLDAESITHLNANPDDIGRLWNGVLIPELSIVKADIVDYFPCSEGGDSKYIQNVTVAIGDEKVLVNRDFEFNLDGWTLYSSGGGSFPVWDNGSAFVSCDGSTGAQYSRLSIDNFCSVVKDDILMCEIDVENLIGSIVFSPISPLTSIAHNVFNNGKTILFIKVDKTTDLYDMHIGINNAYIDIVAQANIKSVSVKKVTAEEVTNFTDACRTTYLNTEYGMSNFPFTQDASGRMTGLGVSGEFVGADDGRAITLPLTTPQDYLVTECIKHIEGDASTITVTDCDNDEHIVNTAQG